MVIEKSSRFAMVAVFSTVLLLLPNNVVSKPFTNTERKSRNWITESVIAALKGTRPGEQAQPGLAFIKLETLSGRTSIPADASIVIQGDSSLRLFKETDITHPSFDPSKFLKLATNDSVQAVEVSPVSDQPYFMFVPPALLKNETFTSALFGIPKKRRIKRHHPGLLQNVLGELQNYALVPIKSTNGQIRYILLKNPKFVIGNPATNGQNGQPPPTIIQLNSNNLPAGLTSGKVRYTPKVPAVKAPAPTLRRRMKTRLPPTVPMATSIDSSFNTKDTVSDRSKTSSVKRTKTKTKTSVTAMQRPMPNIPRTWKELKRNIGTQRKIMNPVSKLQPRMFGPVSQTDRQMLTPVLQAKTQVLTPVVRTNTQVLSPVLGTKTQILTPVLETKIQTQVLTPFVGTKTPVLTPVSQTKNQVFKAASQTPVSETETINVRKESKSVAADKVVSSAGSTKEDANGLKSAVANATLSKTEANVTNVDQTNSKNITITKVGDSHMIEQTEIVETVVDVKKNETATKTDNAASKVVVSDPVHSGNAGHGHGGMIVTTNPQGPDGSNAVLANSGASEKATAEKQAQVVKKTKKTTTILLKSGSETKSGKAEISEIQHTVEELVHHNTSETAAAETAAASNVDMTHSETHGSHGHSGGSAHAHSHGSHTHVDSEQSGAAEAKKETNSTSKSVKTKSVKQTLIKKNIPDPNLNNSSGLAGASSGSAGKPTGGFDVQHVEHVVQETEHKTVDTSEKTNQKATSSNANEVHHHPHHHHH